MEGVSGSPSPDTRSLKAGGSGDAINNLSGSVSDSVLTSNSPVMAGSEIEEVTEKETVENLVD